MTMTTGKKLVAALSLGLVSLTGAAATPAFARHHEYRPGDYYRGYDYSRGGYEDGYYRRGNYYDGHRRDRGHYDRDWNYRCRDEGKGGAVIGAIAGGLLGSAVTERGSKTTGTVVGAAVGAVTGHLIDKSDGRRC
ncbi:MAG: glycine zipper 2TM domain-containing protein [Sphingobium sp.]|jgi:hypothetical protein|nr:glycine zipper 2TM domain-containing protein [Sphingobium sp.]MCI1271064.1 glycine zipper 2TM domain-containing protein [Sphingobium sp.]MCI1755698.1 glycine zipper 2TM domain-containing protein [Sphingobium sp.]MCI2052596.1 glycine zipper 2TM domain-containing protein [Sphingobium sp.]